MNEAPHEKITPSSLGLRHEGRSLLVNVELANVTEKRVGRAADRVVQAVRGPNGNPHIGLGGQTSARGHLLRFLVNTDEESAVVLQRVRGALVRALIRCKVTVGTTTEDDALEVWSTEPGRRALAPYREPPLSDGDVDEALAHANSYAGKLDAADTAPPFHALFRDPVLDRYNREFIRYNGADFDGTRDILGRAQEDASSQGITFDQYMGEAEGEGQGSEILNWYSNGPAPAPRVGMMALFHPQAHKRNWDAVYDVASSIAKACRRWAWIVECDGSRWVMVLLGGDPSVEGAMEASSSPGDQYIAVISPAGEFKMVGAS